MALRQPIADRDVERSLLAAARLGDARSFEALIEPHRRALHLHCYRMTASLTDADDMLQESLLKAWRRIDSFQGGAFRAWLYTIATNTCLNELAARSRTPFLAERRWSGGPPLTEIEHLQPYPDRLMDDDADPAARLDLKESVALAFIAAIQLLPARQRAVLLLRDVLAWSAREVAEALDCSVASANSALQRARGTLRARHADGASGSYVLSVDDITQTRLLARFSDAWERCDFDALASLLLEDAILAMPPASVTQPGSPHAAPLSLHGRAAIIDFFSTVPEGGHLDRIRLVPVGSNRQLALAAYIESPDEGGRQYYGAMVFSFTDGGISAIAGFADSTLNDYFGLPSWIPADTQG